MHALISCQHSATVVFLFKVFVPQTKSEGKPHLFPFMLSTEEDTELSSLYQKVSRTMIEVHRGSRSADELLKIAEEWCVCVCVCCVFVCLSPDIYVHCMCVHTHMHMHMYVVSCVSCLNAAFLLQLRPLLDRLHPSGFHQPQTGQEGLLSDGRLAGGLLRVL